MAEGFFSQLREKLDVCGTPANELDRECWTSFARVLFRTNEFLYVD